jgi:hypothetical protein
MPTRWRYQRTQKIDKTVGTKKVRFTHRIVGSSATGAAFLPAAAGPILPPKGRGHSLPTPSLSIIIYF